MQAFILLEHPMIMKEKVSNFRRKFQRSQWEKECWQSMREFHTNLRKIAPFTLVDLQCIKKFKASILWKQIQSCWNNIYMRKLVCIILIKHEKKRSSRKPKPPMNEQPRDSEPTSRWTKLGKIKSHETHIPSRTSRGKASCFTGKTWNRKCRWVCYQLPVFISKRLLLTVNGFQHAFFELEESLKSTW